MFLFTFFRRIIFKTWNYIIVCLISASLTILTYRFSTQSNRFNLLFSFTNLYPNFSNIFTCDVYDAINKSFSSYFRFCKGRNELKPNEGECSDLFGFSSTLVESLETLALMKDHTLFRKAKQYLQSNNYFSTLELVDRHEFWSRVIGSFIGTYIITHDTFFLKQATFLADETIKIETLNNNNYPAFINFKDSTVKHRPFQNGTALSDILVGLPEISALYLLTKKEKYNERANFLVDSVPPPPLRGVHYHFYDMKTKKPNSPLYFQPNFQETNDETYPSLTFEEIDGNTVGFYINLALDIKLRGNKKATLLLEHSSKHLNGSLGKDFYIIWPLLETIDLISDYHFFHLGEKEVEIRDTAYEAYEGPQFKIFQWTSLNQSSNTLYNFQFSGTIPRLWLKKASIFESEGLRKKLKKLFAFSLGHCKYGYGFSSFKRTNDGIYLYSDIQNSEFLSEWMKAALLLANRDDDLVKKMIINDRGHILAISKG